MGILPNNVNDLQVVYKNGTIKGILSFRAMRFSHSQTISRVFLAVWYEKVIENTEVNEEGLVIYEKRGNGYEESFRFVDKAQRRFQELAPLNSMQVPGVIVTFSSEEHWSGETTVIAFVNDKFQVVYQGKASEFVDLNGDGIAEIFESSWPNGDGFPKKTIVYIWNGSGYQKLTVSMWDERFGRAVQSLLKKHFSKKQNKM